MPSLLLKPLTPADVPQASSIDRRDGAKRRPSSSVQRKETNVERYSNGIERRRFKGKVWSKEREKDLTQALARMEWDKPRASKTESAVVHGSWAASRQRVRVALQSAGVATSRLQRWDSCGSLAWVEERDDGKKLRIRCTRCKDRFCRTCATRRRQQQVSRLLGLVDNLQGEIRLITLTLRHSTATLTQQLDRLYECFRRLRQRQQWKENVRASAAACEFTMDELGRWHVHVHVLAYGRYWPQHQISAEWEAVTGDSKIVDVRRPPAERAVHYAAKYIGKTLPQEIMNNHAALVEAIKALKGRRLLIVTGEWVGKLSEETNDGTSKHEWIGVDYIEQIVRRAGEGSEADRSILARLRIAYTDRAPFVERISGEPPGRN